MLLIVVILSSFLYCTSFVQLLVIEYPEYHEIDLVQNYFSRVDYKLKTRICYILALTSLLNLLCSYSYSNKINLPSFADARKFKMDNETLNKYQKPVLLFMKHLAMLAPQGWIIIDVIAGTGTTGAWSLRSSYLVKLKSLNLTNFNFVFR